MSSVYDEPAPPKKSKVRRADPDDEGPSPSKAGRKGKRKSEVISDPDDNEDVSFRACLS